MDHEDCTKSALKVDKIEGPAVFVFSMPTPERLRKLLLVSALMNVVSTALLLVDAIAAYMR